jgi:uncharacterized membrane protein
MESYIVDWLRLILRWLHLITGIAWIGASFYFIWLDNSLEDAAAVEEGQGHQGRPVGRARRGHLRGRQVPRRTRGDAAILHWFKWEAYSTWLTGMALLVLSLLRRRRVLPYRSARGGTQALGGHRSRRRLYRSAAGLLYMLLCASPLAKRGWLLLALLLLVLGGALAWGLTRFSAAAAPISTSAPSSARSWSAMCSR